MTCDFRFALRIGLAGVLVLSTGACGGGSDAPPPSAFVVTSAADAGPGTLRELIATAPPGSTTTFQAGLADVVLTSGPLTVSNSVTIQGPGAGTLAIEGGGAIDLFDIQAGATVQIVDVTLGNSGRGLECFGTCVVRRVIFDGCGGNFGGAFEIHGGGDLTLADCTIRNCAVFNGAGGGVNMDGSLLARRCTWNENTTTGNSGGGLVLTDGVAVLINCTSSHNMATGSGVGGAIAALSDITSSAVTLIHCTLVQNSSASRGGGVMVSDSDLDCRACIIASNTAVVSGPDVDFSGADTFARSGWNVVGADDGSPFVDGIMGDQVGTLAVPLNPLLSAFADNGGPTLTHALMPASPANDRIPVANCQDETGQPLDHDQRGFARPSGATCDVGAFEL